MVSGVDVTRLVHEIWIDAENRPGCCLSGPMGDQARARFAEDGARLVHTFEAGSHFEAMQIYNLYLGREPYTTIYPEQDQLPYPESWLPQ